MAKKRKRRPKKKQGIGFTNIMYIAVAIGFTALIAPNLFNKR